MKILHICPGYFQRQLYDKLFLALQSVGIINEVYALSYKNIKNSEDKPYCLTVHDKTFSLFDRLVYFRKQHIVFKNICHSYSLYEFNLIQAHTLFSSGFSAYLIHKKFGLPYCVTIRNTDLNVFFKYLFHLRGIGRIIMYNAKNIFFLSSSYRDFVIDNYIPTRKRQSIVEKSFIIPNGIDEYFLENKYCVKRKATIDYINLIYIGEVCANKNIETTIKSCKLLLSHGYNVKYTIVGEIINTKYKKIFMKHKFINYIPKCSKQEVVFHLRNSDIFIMPSILESFGLVYAEAMSQGVPIIYSRGQGFDEQFENGLVGFAVNCLDHKEITESIIKIYKNYQQFSERCINMADKFNWITIAKDYKRLFEEQFPDFQKY